MPEPTIAQKAPYETEITAGKSYAWCACGRSSSQPFCDGSHSDTGMMPVVWKAEKDETVFLCGCKRTGSQPFCDGAHGRIK